MSLLSPPRRFFSHMMWDYSIQNSHIFTHYEITNYPVKWLKYLLLERVGLTTQCDLHNRIHRFKLNQLYLLKRKCKSILKYHQKQEIEIMIVLKIIFPDKAGQLPNLKISSKEDLDKINNFVSIYLHQLSEIWICVSHTTAHAGNFGGRVTFPIGNDFCLSYLEIVWFTSPRKIDTFEYINSLYPFLSASRLPSTRQYEINKIYIPNHYEMSGLFTKKDLITDYRWTLMNVYSLQGKILILDGILSGSGAKEVSLEFLSNSGKFGVIDWDTEVETTY